MSTEPKTQPPPPAAADTAGEGDPQLVDNPVAPAVEKTGSDKDKRDEQLVIPAPVPLLVAGAGVVTAGLAGLYAAGGPWAAGAGVALAGAAAAARISRRRQQRADRLGLAFGERPPPMRRGTEGRPGGQSGRTSAGSGLSSVRPAGVSTGRRAPSVSGAGQSGRWDKRPAGQSTGRTPGVRGGTAGQSGRTAGGQSRPAPVSGGRPARGVRSGKGGQSSPGRWSPFGQSRSRTAGAGQSGTVDSPDRKPRPMSRKARAARAAVSEGVQPSKRTAGKARRTVRQRPGLSAGRSARAAGAWLRQAWTAEPAQPPAGWQPGMVRRGAARSRAWWTPRWARLTARWRPTPPPPAATARPTAPMSRAPEPAPERITPPKTAGQISGGTVMGKGHRASKRVVGAVGGAAMALVDAAENFREACGRWDNDAMAEYTDLLMGVQLSLENIGSGIQSLHEHAMNNPAPDSTREGLDILREAQGRVADLAFELVGDWNRDTADRFADMEKPNAEKWDAARNLR